MRLHSEITAPEALGRAERARMFALMKAHFAGVRRRHFEQDLAEKRWVMLLRDEAGLIQGFTTLMTLEAVVQGEPVRAVFSGDTIVDRAYWGEPTLALSWGRFVLSLADRWPDRRLFWFLISKGVRTYRFLPVYFQQFYPRCDRPTPAFEQAVLTAFAQLKFGAAYDPARGLIRVAGRCDRLATALAEVPPGRLRDPHVRYFLETNPGYAEGDELACIAELSRANLKPFVLADLERVQPAIS